jgi:hypothetical protein
MNYFFRGQMQISLPDEGVYAIVDHTTDAGSNPATGGFDRVKLKIQNKTVKVDVNGQPLPDPNDPNKPLIEAMTPGATLVAVAKFHRNTCYKADLSGEYGSGANVFDCRNPVEEIVTSEIAGTPDNINTAPSAVTFTFTKKIPIAATDLYLQVVYRGPLGRRRMQWWSRRRTSRNRPMVFNVSRWDQYKFKFAYPDNTTGGTLSYADWCATATNPPFPSLTDCNVANGLGTKTQWGPTGAAIPNYDPNGVNPGPEATWLPIGSERPFSPAVETMAPIGTLSRVAWLIDADPTSSVVDIIESKDPVHNEALFQWFSGTPRATTVQADAAGVVRWSDTYQPSRVDSATGRPLYVPPGLATLLTSGDFTPLPPLTLRSAVGDHVPAKLIGAALTAM